MQRNNARQLSTSISAVGQHTHSYPIRRAAVVARLPHALRKQRHDQPPSPASAPTFTWHPLSWTQRPGSSASRTRPGRWSPRTVASAGTVVHSNRRYGSPANKPQPWQVVTAVCAVAMLLCNFHRSVFTALLPLLADGLGLAPSEVGLLQSSMLWGYLAGQIPAGRLADEQGGDRVLLGGLALWSLATAATAASALAVGAAAPGAALAAVLAARVGMGLFSSAIMPCIAATTAQWVPPDRKARTLAMIYAFFNLGGVLGLIAAPHMAARSGWPSAFVTAAAGGIMWSLLGSAIVSRIGPRPALRPQSQSRSPPSSPSAAATSAPAALPGSGVAGQTADGRSSVIAAASAAPFALGLQEHHSGQEKGKAGAATREGGAAASRRTDPSLSPVSTSSLSPSYPSTSSQLDSPSSSSPAPPQGSSSSGKEAGSRGSAAGAGDAAGPAPSRDAAGAGGPGAGAASFWPLDRAVSHAAASTSNRDQGPTRIAHATLPTAATPEGDSAAGAPAFAPLATAREAVAGPAGVAPSVADKRRTRIQLAALCWCHGVIGWGFFVMQSWLPLYLQSLGVARLADAGLLASLPWLAAAFTATVAAGFADRLVRRPGMDRLTVRRGMHAVSTLGCAAALLPLAAAPAAGAAAVGAAAVPPLVATLCLVAAVGCYGFAFGGFHAYVQDVAAADAGKVLGLTNFTATVGGIAGNLATGWILQATGGYGGVFFVAACLYCSSWLVFTFVLNGEPLSLAAAGG